MTRVLLAEDDPAISEPLARALRREGYEVDVRADGRAALEGANENPDLVVLDLGLPFIDGLEVCRRMRADGRTVPVLILTARADEVDLVVGLDAGADDYVTKPVRIRELIARLEAHIRKVGVLTEQAAVEAPPQERQKRFGEVDVDLAARTVSVAGHPLSLAPLEFSLLEYLARNPGVAISRDQIMREVYGFAADISTERVDQLVRRLRTKLGDGPGRGGVLVAVPGYGYRLEQGAPQPA